MPDKTQTSPAGASQDGDFSSERIGREAQRLYRAIFRRQIPGVVVERYAMACARLNADRDTGELERYYRAIERTRDLEALELACRVQRKLTPLPERFRLMVFLAETLPENQSLFVSRDQRRARAWWGIVRGGLRSAWKLLKGSVLLRRLDDV